MPSARKAMVNSTHVLILFPSTMVHKSRLQSMERKIKNSIFQIEVGQWYNLTICQEEINGKKFKFTATVTDEGDTETEGEFKIVFC